MTARGQTEGSGQISSLTTLGHDHIFCIDDTACLDEWACAQPWTCPFISPDNWETFSGGTSTLVHHGFSWYISLLYLHDCEMKFPNSNFYIELKPIPDDFFSFSFETCTARYLLNFPHDWSSLTTNSESANSLYTNCPLAVNSISESRPF